MKKICIKNRLVGETYPPYIIAEMACAHNGSLKKALEITKASAKAGADAIQLQFFSRDHLMSPAHPAYNVLGQLELKVEDWKKVMGLARKLGLDIFVCVYDLPSLKAAVEFNVDGIKINSSDLSNYDMLEAVVATGLPFTLGTGASLLDEIVESTTFIRELGAWSRVIIMHGMQNFPTKISDASLYRIILLKKIFNCVIGYQDHTNGDDILSGCIDLIALGMGASVFEKHITLNRDWHETDYEAALEPRDFELYVKCIRNGAKALGCMYPLPLNEAELNYRKFQKKQIVAAEDLPENTIITKENIAFLRTGNINGISPSMSDTIIGKKILRSLKKGELLKKNFCVDYEEKEVKNERKL